MTTEIESAFLAAAMDAVDELATVETRTGTDYRTRQPSAQTTLIVACDDCENVVGGLWKATVLFRLEAPYSDSGRDTYEAQCKGLRDWLAGEVEPELGGGLSLAGFKLLKSEAKTEEAQWAHEISLMAGVDTSA